MPEALRIPRTLLEPSPTNPRKHFDAARLEEMRETIRRHGVLEPLVVRPIEGRDATNGQPLYEIVSGERRWRASEGAQAELPCMVQQLSDLDVLEIQVIENVQRDNLHPLEEADGYEQLLLDPPWWSPNHRPRLAGYGIDELAQRVGKSRSHVYARLRLLGLTPAARHAFFDAAFGITSALQIARLNTQHQEELVQGLVHDAAKGAAWSADTISRTVQQRYMLRLAGAPFNLHDATLVPTAGACAACPKRSGANPELFDDITEADTCADRACYATKCAALEVATITLAEENGYSIIQGDEAQRLLTSPDATIKGYLRLDRPSDFALSNKPLGEVLGSDARDVVLIVRRNGEDVPSTMVEVMPTPIVRQVLKDKGLLKPDEPAAAPNARPARETKKVNRETKLQPGAAKAGAGETTATAAETGALPAELQKWIDELEVLPPHLRKGKHGGDATLARGYRKRCASGIEQLLLANLVGAAVADDGANGLPSEGLARLLLTQVWYGIGSRDRSLVASLAGLPPPDPKQRDDVDWIWSLDEEQASVGLLVALALVEEDHDIKPERSARAVLGDVLSLDTSDLPAHAARIVDAKLAAELASIAPKPRPKTAAKKPAPAKQAPKKPSAKKAPACKYRYAMTGETWSGRGLQPKWLKVALANGMTLADFDVANIAKATAEPAPTVAKAQLSPMAAWPFPTGSDSTKITALQLDAARTHVIGSRDATNISVQRALSVSIGMASKLLEQLEQQKVVGPMDKDGQRKVLATSLAGEGVGS